MNIADWIHDDITWCGEECDFTECMRNTKNKRQKTGIFTMSFLKGTDLCPLNSKGENDDIQRISRENNVHK